LYATESLAANRRGIEGAGLVTKSVYGRPVLSLEGSSKRLTEKPEVDPTVDSPKK
jgi:hypothetical protein